MGYLAVLAFANAHVLYVSPALVGLVELAIYLLCGAQLVQRFSPSLLAVGLAIGSMLVFLWLFRQAVDPKSFRDLLIPVLFFGLGQAVADRRLADGLVSATLAILVLVGFFELLFLDLYSQIFQPLSLYINLGTMTQEQSIYADQALSLNGFRPEGIGRSLMPELLGSHRVSSLYMEPPSLGGAAIIFGAWALARAKDEPRKAAAWLAGTLVLIVLADSRFGTLTFVALVLTRMVPATVADYASRCLPFAAVAACLLVAGLWPEVGDNYMGRLTTTGNALSDMSFEAVLGLSRLTLTYSDSGYAYVLSRFGMPLALGLFVTVCLLRPRDDASRHFRAFVLVYVSLYLCVSGTTIFALKTSGLLWFLCGVIFAAAPAAASAFRGWTDQKLLRRERLGSSA